MQMTEVHRIRSQICLRKESMTMKAFVKELRNLTLTVADSDKILLNW